MAPTQSIDSRQCAISAAEFRPVEFPSRGSLGRPRTGSSVGSNTVTSRSSLLGTSSRIGSRSGSSSRTDLFATEPRVEVSLRQQASDIDLTESRIAQREELEENLLSMNNIFEDELRRAAFRMADEDGVGFLPKETCRSILKGLAMNEGRREAVVALRIPDEVDLETFLRIADSFL
mmetsp:Transcript_14512/g.22760  ORF Transcript_14512/g.22760 Transcript_14512/m.22760 type:complete len:176 (+) Transcript_14512:46-573(+)